MILTIICGVILGVLAFLLHSYFFEKDLYENFFNIINDIKERRNK